MKEIFHSIKVTCRSSDPRLVSLFSGESIMLMVAVDCDIRGNAVGFLCESRACTAIHKRDGCPSYSLWIFQTAAGLHSPRTTGAAAHAASTRRPPRSRSAAAAAAAIHPASPLFVPRNPRTVALAPRKIYSMIVIKVRGESST